MSGQAPTLPTPAPIFLDLPDTGFGEILPFGVLPDEAEPGEEDAVLPTSPRQREIAQFNRNRPLIPVAAGAVLLVLAAHIRLLNVRTKPTVVSRKLPPGAYVARALAEARSTRVVVDVDAAVANGGHHRAPPPPSDDVAGLPVWAEFEPVSAMGLFDEYDGNGGNSSNGGNGEQQFERYTADSRPVIVPDPNLAYRPEPVYEPEPAAFEPAPPPVAAPQPQSAPQPVYDHAEHDDDRQWADEPEVFVSPRS